MAKSFKLYEILLLKNRRVEKEVERLGEKEDDLDHIYRDDEGRYYEIIDGIPTYLDDRGFDYY